MTTRELQKMPEQGNKNNMKKERSGGVESSLESVGIFYFILSIFGLIACMILSNQEETKRIGLSSLWIGIGIAAIAQGIIFSIIFRAGAEIVRLLKRLNGLPYAGSISETTGETKSYLCSDCGAQASVVDKVCTQCGAKL